MNSFFKLLAATLCVMAVACGGGDAALGEECGASGADGECAEGGVCGKNADGDDGLLCLKTCVEQEDCADGEECNGVEGSATKGCRTKESK